MPVTFLAHQAPLLPVIRRWPRRFDAVTLMIGSMAPDLAFLVSGSRFRIWAHDLPWMVLFGVPVTLAISVIVVRVISPVVWDHLPNLEPFHLHDLRGIAAHRFAWGWASVCALIGITSHVAIDSFTHDWGWFAQNVDWYSAALFEAPTGRPITAFTIGQYGGHVIGTGVCLWLLARYGRARWMAEPASQIPAYPVSARSTALLAGAVAVALVAGAIWILSGPVSVAIPVIRVAWLVFGAVTLACIVLQLSARDVRSRPQR